ncbi:hypothetical protein M2459_002400 [Parabacteroides sp. PF5-5]|nr:hypothetical protein [Parabacteroides sp. PH5-39]MDH6316653.1 hypothetical protein [Parabacteroides sp. PF5-13]MDH6320167.1 hypothetical protein [Parabacteroides sp. PH5-13]MDH6323890.1 hypothetical protein [Parabacteroides sp. PH5-8]MDH6327844.1 hypothetical protein [Parabacteroides sp. PH5-41]MDH6335640.1 hypothetical protein [Parabacteroides sp. PF5-5]MDH6346708.1 hypothetical protein [Parabacteroides sp. PH5-46]MDH6361666.1 hypothetical protein [Parabacteroides sp. PH5-16]MDH6377333.
MGIISNCRYYFSMIVIILLILLILEYSEAFLYICALVSNNGKQIFIFKSRHRFSPLHLSIINDNY